MPRAVVGQDRHNEHASDGLTPTDLVHRVLVNHEIEVAKS
jgi:hypothetical protein